MPITKNQKDSVVRVIRSLKASETLWWDRYKKSKDTEHKSKALQYRAQIKGMREATRLITHSD